MDGIKFNTEVYFNIKGLQDKFGAMFDDKTWIEIYNLWGKMMEPWVPMDSGILSHSYIVSPQYIMYHGPYAHYQYMGIVYGPNIPLFDNQGNLVGFRSPPGKGSKSPKVPAQELVYNTEKHPLASKEWDKASWATIKDSFLEGVKDILVRRAKQLYG